MKSDAFTTPAPETLSTLPRRHECYTYPTKFHDHISTDLRDTGYSPCLQILWNVVMLLEGLQPQETCDIFSLLIKSKGVF